MNAEIENMMMQDRLSREEIEVGILQSKYYIYSIELYLYNVITKIFTESKTGKRCQRL